MTTSTGSDAPIRVAQRHRTTLIPRTCGSANGSYDVLIHFHGVETAMAPAYIDSGLESVLVIINLGEFSGPYETQYAVPGSLDNLIDQIESTIKKYCPASHLGRVALSAWSGGYGAVFRILAREAEAKRVDAVLLADGLHVGFTNARTRQINELQMVPFVRFSQRAARGETLFAITHTQIRTPYASTTETADYLLQVNGVERVDAEKPGPRPGMTLVSSATGHGLRVFGYGGNDTRAHCDHLHAIGQTLLPLLRERWSGADVVDAGPPVEPSRPALMPDRPAFFTPDAITGSSLIDVGTFNPSEPTLLPSQETLAAPSSAFLSVDSSVDPNP